MKLLYSTSVAILAALTFNTGYAEQMCNDSVEVTTPSSRFEINDDQAFDTKTGLVWKRCLEGQNWNAELSQCDGNAISVNWKDALESVSEGWRLPNIKEPGSIVEHSRFGKGEILRIEGAGADKKAEINFQHGGIKKLLLRFAKLNIIS